MPITRDSYGKVVCPGCGQPAADFKITCGNPGCAHLEPLPENEMLQRPDLRWPSGWPQHPKPR